MEFTGGDNRVETLGLVCNEPGRLCMFASEFRYMLVSRRQALAGIDDHNGRICLLQRANRLLDHALVDADLASGDATRIDNKIGQRPEPAKAVLTVARQARIIRDQRITRSRQAIEQR